MAPEKTSQTTGKMLRIRVMPELQAALDAMPHSDALTFLLTEHGRPFKSAAAFGNKFADWCTAAGLEPKLCDNDASLTEVQVYLDESSMLMAEAAMVKRAFRW